MKVKVFVNKKLKIEFIRAEFAKEDYILLTKIYENNKQKLDYICPNNNKHNINWSNWQQNKRCPCCAGLAKPTMEFVREQFEKEGYTLLTKKYRNSYQKLDYICPEGHKHSISWNKWQQKCRCPYCAGRKKLTIEFIREEFKKENYTLLTKYYKDAKQKLDYICPNGHKHIICWNDWQQGCRCPRCAVINSVISNMGPGNPNWKGGISCEPYCDTWLDTDFKESIKQRDGYKCMNPDCWNTSKRLSIHHIDYVKKNCDPKNLITLCTSCNTRANTDRGWHISWYQTILQKRYGKDYIQAK